jgi:putative hydrolase of the HAD superfamily
MANVYAVVFFDLGNTLVADSKWLSGAKETIVQLLQRGMRLGIISNTRQFTRAELAALLPTDFNWNDFENDLTILSSEVGVEKPSLEIFRLAIKKSGLKPRQCLFCTENLIDALAAQQVGMHTARLQEPPQSDIAVLMQALEKIESIILT